MITEANERIAVFSDIHGNVHALGAVMEAIDRMSIRKMVCLGDIVGYGAFPNECCEMLRFRHVPAIAGNHDHAALGKTDIQYFNEIAKAAIEWTRLRLSPENMKWLEKLPFSIRDSGCMFVHATPQNPEKWGYVLTFGDARNCFASFEERFCFIGHSHQPSIVEMNGEELTCPEGTRLSLTDGRRYLVNVGSVGQPRDHNPNACFVTLDMGEGALQFHRVAYDVPSAQQAIVEGNLPQELAERLAFGW